MERTYTEHQALKIHGELMARGWKLTESIMNDGVTVKHYRRSDGTAGALTIEPAGPDRFYVDPMGSAISTDTYNLLERLP